MKKLLFFLFFPLFLYSQTQESEPKLPSVIPPSPTVASLMHFEEVPVDTYSGQPNIAIPLASKNLGSGLVLPIALRYSTLGLRVHERSGWVGKGWSLEAGGTISRTVRGVADEKQQSPGRNQIGIYFVEDDNNGINLFENYESLAECEKKEYAWNVMGTKYQQWDSQPDLYQYSMLGMSGRFVVLKENNVLVAKQLSLDNKVDIDLIYDNNYIISSFTITDSNGIKYIFGNGAIETNESTPVSLVYPRKRRGGGEANTVAPNVGTHPSTSTSAWHLVSIVVNRGGGAYQDEELASFSYTESIENYSTRQTRTENKLIESGTQYNDILTNPENIKYFKPERIISWANIKATTKKLSSINFRDGSSYEFVPSSQTNPENEGVYLDHILLKDKLGSSYKSIQLNHVTKATKKLTQGFDGSYNKEIDLSARLWLEGITIGSLPDQQKYLFEYFDNDNFMAVTSENVDHWGYENGDFRGVSYGNKGYFYYDYDAVKRGVLTKITEPSGGVKEFVFEPHTYTYEYGNELLDDYDENPLNEYEQTSENSFYVGVHTHSMDDVHGGFNVNLTHHQDINIDVIITLNPEYISLTTLEIEGTLLEGGQYNITYSLSDIDNLYNGLLPMPAGSFHFTVIGQPGSYTPGGNLPNNYGATGEQHVGGYINLRYRANRNRTSTDYKNYLFGGGLRIKHIDFKDMLSPSPLKRRFTYDYHTAIDSSYVPELSGPGGVSNPINPVDPIDNSLPSIEYKYVHSNGTIDGSHTINKNYVIKDNRYLFNHYENNSNSVYDEYTIAYKVTINEPVVFLTKGSFVGYRSVKVSEGENTIAEDAVEIYHPKGYTKYEYTSAYDDPIGVAYFGYPYKELPEIDYKRGLLLKTTVYNDLEQKLKETVNEYDTIEGASVFSFTVEEGGWADGTCIWRPFYETWEQYSAMIPPPQLRQYCSLGPLSGGGAITECFNSYFNCEEQYDCSIEESSIYVLERSDITSYRSVLASSQNIEYYYDNDVVTTTNTATSYTYNTNNYQIASTTTTIAEGAETNEYKTEYEYPVGGYTASLFSSSEQIALGAMVQRNIINTPIVVSHYKNDEPLQKVVTKYDNFNGLLLPSKAATLKGDETTTHDRVVYHNYNEIGNVTEVSQAKGTHVYYIWGYEGTLPIAKIDDLTSSDLEDMLTIQDLIVAAKSASNNHVYVYGDSNNTEQDLKYALDSLRNALSDYQVTTLVYDAAKGVVLSTKDPRGRETNYTYDSHGRLKEVRDHEGNILSENEYHYRD